MTQHTDLTGTTPHFLVAARRARVRRARVATLGPAGTSSERAAGRLLALVGARPGDVLLLDTYHDAADAVLDRRADFLVVANAYHEINIFYMDSRLNVSAVFHMYTPLYGLAVRDEVTVPREMKVVSHPAPVPLVAELVPSGHSCVEISLAPSTSAAAEAVARGEHEVALTTEPAAKANGLRFVSKLRHIEMVWTAFVRDEVESERADLS